MAGGVERGAGPVPEEAADRLNLKSREVDHAREALSVAHQPLVVARSRRNERERLTVDEGQRQAHLIEHDHPPPAHLTNRVERAERVPDQLEDVADEHEVEHAKAGLRQVVDRAVDVGDAGAERLGGGRERHAPPRRPLASAGAEVELRVLPGRIGKVTCHDLADAPTLHLEHPKPVHRPDVETAQPGHRLGPRHPGRGGPKVPEALGYSAVWQIDRVPPFKVPHRRQGSARDETGGICTSARNAHPLGGAMWGETVVATDRMDVPALVAGDEEAKPVLCFHGFPDNPWTFTPLAERLLDRGWRVVAPFLRGFHRDAIPAESHFGGETIVADAVALCRALAGDDPVAVIGHDFGASVVYGLAMAFPERLRAGVAMAVPPLHMFPRMLHDPEQLRQLFYMFFFQLEDWPERVLGTSSDLIDFLWRTWSPGLAEPEHMDAVRAQFTDPEIIRCTLGYYRANFQQEYRDPALSELRNQAPRELQVPVLVLGGTDDGCVKAEHMRAASAEVPEHCRVEVLDGVGHFLHLEAPDAVAERIDRWLRN